MKAKAVHRRSNSSDSKRKRYGVHDQGSTMLGLCVPSVFCSSGVLPLNQTCVERGRNLGNVNRSGDRLATSEIDEQRNARELRIARCLMETSLAATA